MTRTCERALLDRHDGRVLRADLQQNLRAGSRDKLMNVPIVKRYLHNPILTKAEIPYAVETVHNAAVVKW